MRASGAGIFDGLGPQVLLADGGAWRAGLHRGRMHLGEGELAVLVLCFRGPRSYTGEDALELQLPGNPVLLERVVDALIGAGRGAGLDVRRAEPGEFTARAFLNGRLSLTEAEGVAATIAARSDAELRAAGLLTGGALGALATALAEALAQALALVEAGIDFTDQEDVVTIAPDELARKLASLQERIETHLARAVGTEQLEAIPWVVLSGQPNAGKSTLFNALLGRRRAVVSATAGTTRDVLAEPLRIETAQGPAEVMLVDLAGADDQMNAPWERLARQAAVEARRRAELIVHCVPVDAPTDAPAPPAALVVPTKADLDPHAAPEAVSARTGHGLEALRRQIAQRLAARTVSLAADALALRPRHETLLRSAAAHLAEARALVGPARGARALDQPELVAAALRLALDDLGQLAGRITPDDVLGRIFASFCIGK